MYVLRNDAVLAEARAPERQSTSQWGTGDVLRIEHDSGYPALYRLEAERLVGAIGWVMRAISEG